MPRVVDELVTWPRGGGYALLFVDPAASVWLSTTDAAMTFGREPVSAVRHDERNGVLMRSRCRRGARGVAALVLVLGTAACEADTTGDDSDQPRGEPQTETSQPDTAAAAGSGSEQIAGPNGQALSFTDVEVPSPDKASEASLVVERTLDDEADIDATVGVLAVAPDGDVLVSRSHRSDYDAASEQLIASGRVGIWTVDGIEDLGSTEDLVPGDPYRQVVSGVFADGSVAWKETASVNLGTSDWRMFRHDLDGGAPEVLARSEDVFPAGGLARAVGGSILATVGNRVAWHTTYEREDGTLRTKVVSVPVSGGELRTEADLVAMPAGADAGWVTLRMVDATVEGVAKDYQIQDPRRASGIELLEPGGTARELIRFPLGTDDDWAVGRIAAGGDIYAWDMGEHVYVASIDGSVAYRLIQPEGATLDPYGLAVCDSRVAWSVTSGQGEGPNDIFVLDPQTGEVFLLPTENNPSGDITCGGEHIAWTEIEDSNGTDIYTVTLARWQTTAR